MTRPFTEGDWVRSRKQVNRDLGKIESTEPDPDVPDYPLLVSWLFTGPERCSPDELEHADSTELL